MSSALSATIQSKDNAAFCNVCTSCICPPSRELEAQS